MNFAPPFIGFGLSEDANDHAKLPRDGVVDKVVTIAGGVTRLGRALGISHQAVLKWQAKSKVPATRVLEVERLTGVSRHALRPDVFGPLPSSSDRHPSVVSQAGA